MYGVPIRKVKVVDSCRTMGIVLGSQCEENGQVFPHNGGISEPVKVFLDYL